ncbi:DUF1015 family protein [Nocardioides sp. R-C-SC26]|uniref:DUF1015 family protein n=1 Tax=Nocardioides sp. R-C-SC26 TaxID=2870414 RepID=UPI001E64D1B7|nr:DUF1015 family protein [Nocardioides sp. R-C-SC26]
MDSRPALAPPALGGPLRLTPFTALRLAPSRVADPSAGRALARPYRDVAARLQRWQRRGAMIREPGPALYLHEYTASGITVRGLVGLLDVSHRAAPGEPGTVVPHEGIHPSQADDIADRMNEMELNPAPILLVQRSPEALRAELAAVRDQPPSATFTDRREQRHRLWSITDPETLERLAALLSGTDAVIADGHHRYAAYLRLQQRSPGGALDHGLAMVVDQNDTPLFLGAIHRVLHGTSVDDVVAAADALGLSRRETTRADAVAALAPHTLVATDTHRWVVVSLGEGDRPDVDLLHRSLIPQLRHGPTSISFHHSVGDALDGAAREGRVGVLCAAPGFDEVHDFVAAGRLFPEKATSFQPKPPPGVLMRPWNVERAEQR